MKLEIVLLGVVLCLASPAQTPTQTTTPSTKSTESANRMKRPTSSVQSITGCVDQQNGRYVIRDAQSSQLLTLQAPGSDDDTYFARYLGHEAQVSGSKSADTIKVTHIGQVADMCGSGK
jgi:hypothetical protein